MHADSFGDLPLSQPQINSPFPQVITQPAQFPWIAGWWRFRCLQPDMVTRQRTPEVQGTPRHQKMCANTDSQPKWPNHAPDHDAQTPEPPPANAKPRVIHRPPPMTGVGYPNWPLGVSLPTVQPKAGLYSCQAISQCLFCPSRRLIRRFSLTQHCQHATIFAGSGAKPTLPRPPSALAFPGIILAVLTDLVQLRVMWWLSI